MKMKNMMYHNYNSKNKNESSKKGPKIRYAFLVGAHENHVKDVNRKY